MPDKTVFRITWIVILIFLIFDFIFYADKTFLPLNYSWNKLELLNKVDNAIIDTISLDYLEIKLDDISVNTNETFCLKNKYTHYFRATAIKQKDSTFVFSGLKWLNGSPKLNITTTTFQIVDLPLKQRGNKTIITLGDSQMLWRYGREFRRNLAIKKRNICFKGKNRDVYGYPSEAETYMDIKKIADNLTDIEAAENYILFFGAHDKHTDTDTVARLVCDIYKNLSSRPVTEKIFVITLPPSPVLVFEEYNKSLNDILKKCSFSYKDVIIVDLYDYLKDKEGYLQEDGVHLNEYGHYLLSKLILNRL